MHAHYFASKKTQYIIIICNSVRPVGDKIAVSGKVEARRIAKEHGATPYNF